MLLLKGVMKLRAIDAWLRIAEAAAEARVSEAFIEKLIDEKKYCLVVSLFPAFERCGREIWLSDRPLLRVERTTSTRNPKVTNRDRAKAARAKLDAMHLICDRAEKSSPALVAIQKRGRRQRCLTMRPIKLVNPSLLDKPRAFAAALVARNLRKTAKKSRENPCRDRRTHVSGPGGGLKFLSAEGKISWWYHWEEMPI